MAQHINLFGMAAEYFNQANRSNARRGLTAFILLECPPPPADDLSCFFLAEVGGLTDRLHKCRIFRAQLLEDELEAMAGALVESGNYRIQRRLRPRRKRHLGLSSTRGTVPVWQK
jgi:hypothetical protein